MSHRNSRLGRCRALILAIAVGFLPSLAQADSFWFTGNVDELWSDGFNWKALAFPGGPHTMGSVPIPYADTYVTSTGSGAGAMDPGPALIDSGTDADTGAFYVGGWGTSYDSEAGDPAGHRGQLDITGGTLTLSEKLNGGSPPCHYLRLGYRGADGVINQSGGEVIGCTTPTLGYGSPDSVGVWNLRDGIVDVPGISIGVVGTGIVNMEGGEIKPEVVTTGQTNIGVGYAGPGEGYETGVALVNQRGGEIKNYLVRIGRGSGAVGVHAVRKAGLLEATTTISIGSEDAHGSVVQSGGTVTAPLIIIGNGAGSTASYSISNGLLSQTGGNTWLFNGHPNGALSRLMVIGSEPSIQLIRYYQNSRSSAVFMLEPEPPHISPIVADVKILVESGGKLMIERVPDVTATIPSGFTFDPAPGQSFLLMTAPSINATGLTLDPRIEDDWKLELTSTEIHARYCPSGTSEPSCL